MKARRWAEKEVKSVKSICSLSLVLLGVLRNVLLLNVCQSTTVRLRRCSVRFAFLFSCLSSDEFHVIYCLCEGGGKVIKCHLGNGLTHAERCLRDPAGSVPQQCSLARFLPHLRPCALASVVIKKAGRKSVNLALAKYTDLKGIYLGKGKCWDYLGRNWTTHMLCFCRTWSKGLMTSAALITGTENNPNIVLGTACYKSGVFLPF